ncbi:hypothetical protein LIER_02179 [Lithospermum erythrorhizon]|uniref:BTB domain-containing protein n=1 Tax=Lithospermum erythrorhizon TaxID=34254 RepID=A0AAV3NQY9_LITER
MDRTDEKYTSTSEKQLPIPPPSPYFGRHNGVSKSGLSCKGCCSVPGGKQDTWDRLFDEGYGADVLIRTDHGGVIYAHANILGMASPVLRGMLQSRGRRSSRKRSISICGVPPEAVHVFIRFLYSACYDEQKLDEYALQLLMLSHAYVVPHLKRLCEQRIEQRLITSEDTIDIFQLALLCDAPRLSLICHRFILNNFKAVVATDGWKAMKNSHPILERTIMESLVDEDAIRNERTRKANARNVYVELYEAMETLVRICREACCTVGPHKKPSEKEQGACHHDPACKGLELLLRHFGGCKKRVHGGCVQCRRMWQLLDLHSHLCADSDICKVPLCRDFKQKRGNQNKKLEKKWRILVKKIVRSKSITGAPFFSLDSS